MVQYDFDDVGIEQLAHVPDGVAGRGHGRHRRIRKQGRYCTYKAGFDHRLVALDVYDQALRGKPEALYNLRDPVSARGMVAAGHYGLMAVPFYRCSDVAVVGGHVNAARAAFSRPIGDSHDHGPASNIGERLSGKPAGCESRRDNGGEGHAKDLRRSPPRSLVHFFLRRQLSRLLLEHHRNIVPNRERKAVGFADELALRPAIDERPLADRADENVKKSRVHEFVPECDPETDAPRTRGPFAKAPRKTARDCRFRRPRAASFRKARTASKAPHAHQLGTDPPA